MNFFRRLVALSGGTVGSQGAWYPAFLVLGILATGCSATSTPLQVGDDGAPSVGTLGDGNPADSGQSIDAAHNSKQGVIDAADTASSSNPCTSDGDCPLGWLCYAPCECGLEGEQKSCWPPNTQFSCSVCIAHSG